MFLLLPCLSPSCFLLSCLFLPVFPSLHISEVIIFSLSTSFSLLIHCSCFSLPTVFAAFFFLLSISFILFCLLLLLRFLLFCFCLSSIVSFYCSLLCLAYYFPLLFFLFFFLSLFFYLFCFSVFFISALFSHCFLLFSFTLFLPYFCSGFLLLHDLLCLVIMFLFLFSLLFYFCLSIVDSFFSPASSSISLIFYSRYPFLSLCICSI